MGLGKSLTVVALIMTNHHDGRPIAKPNLGYSRPRIEYGRRQGKGKGKSRKKIESPAAPTNVGRKIQATAALKKRAAIGFFSNFKSSDEDSDDKEEKFSFGETAKNFKPKRKRNKVAKCDNDDTDDSFINDETSDEDHVDSADEFDDMAKVI